MKYSTVQVVTKLRDTSFNNSLPVARTKLSIDETGALVAMNEGELGVEPRKYHFSASLPSEASIEDLALKITTSNALKGMLDGISMGMVSFGLEGLKPGSFSPLLVQMVTSLGETIDAFCTSSLNDKSVSLSYGFYGVTDTSCIDLLSYGRRELADVQALQTWNELIPIDSLQTVIESIEQGYSLPCILLIRIFVKGSDPSEPGAMSTLLLADLGSVTGLGAALEKSFAQFRSQLLELPTQSTQSSHSTPLSQPQSCSSFLSAFLNGVIGGQANAVIVADLPVVGTTRSVSSQLQLLDALSKVRNNPTPLLESPEMIELCALVEAHGKLEGEHRAMKTELKQLKKALKANEAEEERLLESKKVLKMSSDSQKFMFEYERARMEIERLQVQERIRQCEIDLLCMEQEKLFLAHEMEVKKAHIVDLEKQLKGTQEAKAEVERDLGDRVNTMTKELNQAQAELSKAESEKTSVKSDLKEATKKIESLEKQITALEKSREQAETSLSKQQSQSTTMSVTLKSEIAQLKAELAMAKKQEEGANKKLSDLEQSLKGQQGLVKDLESKLSVLRMENSTLQAKLEILSKNNSQSPQQNKEVTKTLEAMEEKWRIERESMQSIMNDLRALLRERDPSHSKKQPEVSEPKKKTISIPEVTADVVPIAAPIKLGAKKGIQKVSFSENQPEPEPIQKIFEPTTVAKALPAQSSEPKKRPRVTKVKVQEIKDQSHANVHMDDGEDDHEIPSTPPKPKAKKISKETAPSSSQPLPSKPVVISSMDSMSPVKSQPLPSQSTTNTSTSSPTKVWKPSAFIPGLAPKGKSLTTSSSSNAKENSTLGFLANMSFSQNDSSSGLGGFQKRIKLPGRPQPGVKPANDSLSDTNTAASGRRNVDPNVYSTILNSFNIPGLKK